MLYLWTLQFDFFFFLALGSSLLFRNRDDHGHLWNSVLKVSRWVSDGRSVMSDSLRPHGLEPTRLLCPWNLEARILEWVAISFSMQFDFYIIFICHEMLFFFWFFLNHLKNFKKHSELEPYKNKKKANLKTGPLFKSIIWLATCSIPLLYYFLLDLVKDKQTAKHYLWTSSHTREFWLYQGMFHLTS